MAATRRWLWAAVLLLPSTAWADEVHLKSGGVVRGVIVERTAEVVVIEAGPGRVTLPLFRVSRVVESGSALATFHSQAMALATNDVEGFARLARWAEDHDLATSARQTWQRVLNLDPGHPEANAALGRTYYDGAWMSETDVYRVQGYIAFEGEWVAPAQHEALLRERAERELATSGRREAELRVREAEARAREAEARAREAEAYADQADPPVDGIPYWWVLAGGGALWPPFVGHPRPPATLPARPARPGHQPARPPSVGSPQPGRSIWQTSPPARRPVARPHGRARSASDSGSIH
ncbi:MAG: hypothetical protein V3S03_07555 [Vicinamibacteria bacterium]